MTLQEARDWYAKQLEQAKADLTSVRDRLARDFMNPRPKVQRTSDELRSERLRERINVLQKVVSDLGRIQ